MERLVFSGGSGEEDVAKEKKRKAALHADNEGACRSPKKPSTQENGRASTTQSGRSAGTEVTSVHSIGNAVRDESEFVSNSPFKSSPQQGKGRSDDDGGDLKAATDNNNDDNNASIQHLAQDEYQMTSKSETPHDRWNRHNMRMSPPKEPVRLKLRNFKKKKRNPSWSSPKLVKKKKHGIEDYDSDCTYGLGEGKRSNRTIPVTGSSKSDATRACLRSQDMVFSNNDRLQGERRSYVGSERKNMRGKSGNSDQTQLRTSSKRRKAGSVEENAMVIDCSCYKDDGATVHLPSPTKECEIVERFTEGNSKSAQRINRVGDEECIDAVRIAIGSKVVRSSCELKIHFGTKTPYVEISYREDGKKKIHRIIVANDLKELRYSIARDDENGESSLSSNDYVDAITFISFRVAPNKYNKLNEYADFYDQGNHERLGESKEQWYITVEVRDAQDLLRLTNKMHGHTDFYTFLVSGAEVEQYNVPNFVTALVEDSREDRDRRLGLAGRTRTGGRKVVDTNARVEDEHAEKNSKQPSTSDIQISDSTSNTTPTTSLEGGDMVSHNVHLDGYKNKESSVDLHRDDSDGSRRFTSFENMLKNMTHFTSSTLRRSPIGTAGFEMLANTLSGLPLIMLDLCNCNISEINALDKFLLPNLEYLILAKNYFGSKDDCYAIARFLKRADTKVKTIDLSDCRIEDEGAEIIAKSLENNAMLTRIVLSGNKIGELGCIAFSKLVYDDSSIEAIVSSNYTLTEIFMCSENMDFCSKINIGTKANKENAGNKRAAAYAKIAEGYRLKSEAIKEECTQLRSRIRHNEATIRLNSAVIKAKDQKIKTLVDQNNLLEEKNKILLDKFSNIDKEINELKSELNNSAKIETVDLTADATNQNSAIDGKGLALNQEQGSDIPTSNLALLHNQSQSMVKVKMEAMERATTAERRAEIAQREKDEAKMEADIAQQEKEVAERKAETAIQEKEAAELKLECPACFEVDRVSCALVPCGHTFCSDCCDEYASSKCPTCRSEVASCLRLFK